MFIYKEYSIGYLKANDFTLFIINAFPKSVHLTKKKMRDIFNNF